MSERINTPSASSHWSEEAHCLQRHLKIYHQVVSDSPIVTALSKTAVDTPEMNLLGVCSEICSFSRLQTRPCNPVLTYSASLRDLCWTKTLATISTNKRIFLVAWQLAHVSHVQRASLDELFEPLLFISQRRNFSCQSLSLAQRPLDLQQTTAPVNERKVSGEWNTAV